MFNHAASVEDSAAPKDRKGNDMPNEKLLSCPFLLERFKAKYKVDVSGCWLWTGSQNGKGYGKMLVNGTLMLAHVISYTHFVEAIPVGLTVDHKCKVRNCINPDHLQLLTQKENNLLGNSPTAINKRKTHCIYGHLLEGDNLRLVIRDGQPRRHCKECQRRLKQEHRNRNRL